MTEAKLLNQYLKFLGAQTYSWPADEDINPELINAKAGIAMDDAYDITIPVTIVRGKEEFNFTYHYNVETCERSIVPSDDLKELGEETLDIYLGFVKVYLDDAAKFYGFYAQKPSIFFERSFKWLECLTGFEDATFTVEVLNDNVLKLTSVSQDGEEGVIHFESRRPILSDKVEYPMNRPFVVETRGKANGSFNKVHIWPLECWANITGFFYLYHEHNTTVGS